jgi:hypothetical protein
MTVAIPSEPGSMMLAIGRTHGDQRRERSDPLSLQSHSAALQARVPFEDFANAARRVRIPSPAPKPASDEVGFFRSTTRAWNDLRSDMACPLRAFVGASGSGVIQEATRDNSGSKSLRPGRQMCSQSPALVDVGSVCRNPPPLPSPPRRNAWNARETPRMGLLSYFKQL